MSELRLVPAAVAVWAGVAVFLVTGRPALAGVVLVAAVLVCLLLRQPGQAALTGGLGSVAVSAAAVRVARAAAAQLGPTVSGTVVGEPSRTAGGSWLLNLAVPGHPAQLPVFLEQQPEVAGGAVVAVEVTLADSERPGVGGVVAEGTIVGAAPPEGYRAVTAFIRERLRTTVRETLDGEHAGLIPGMVLGDTTLQPEAAEQLYVETGLSHLSAVSGSNVAIVTTAAVLLCRALALGPREQATAASVALIGFVLLVGTEPSVLRATVTGLVGLAAVVNSSRMEPVHALALSVIVLILVDSDLAVSYGFALSSAATAGIVALSPVLARPLGRTRMPAILARALAVAIAADVVTMPIIAVMAGEVSTVSVLANVLVAPVTAPITILGLITAGLCLLPGPLGGLALHLISPMTWWIHHVAEFSAGLPLSLISAHPVAVLIGYGWLLAALIARKWWVPLLLVAGLGLAGVDKPQAPVVPEARTFTVAAVEDVGKAPPGTQIIVVTDPSGTPAGRPTVTAEGVPVLFPARDGPVTVHADGRQHAADGRF